VENSLLVDVSPHAFGEAIDILQLVDGIDIFRALRLGQAGEVLQVARREDYPSGTVIIKEGTHGDAFYVIASGVVRVTGQGWVRNLIAGDYFGEMALVSGDPRTATVVAKTDTQLIKFSKHDFLTLIRGNPETLRLIRQLTETRKQHSWELISTNQALSRMTNSQKTHLQAIMHRKDVKQNEWLWKKNDPANEAFIVSSGSFIFPDQNLQPFTRGAFLGEVNALLGEELHTTSVQTQRDGTVYIIPRKELIIFWDQNPGVQLAFLGTLFIDTIKQDLSNGVGIANYEEQ